MFGNKFRQPRRDRLQHKAERARFFEDLCIFQQALRRSCSFALCAEAAKLMHGLRREAKMTHDRNARSHDDADRICPFAPAFEFDRVHAAVLQKTPRIADGIFHRNLIRHERHIAHQQRRLCPASHGAGVMEHFIHGNGQGVFVAENNHPERISDEDGIDARLVHCQRSGIVVGS